MSILVDTTARKALYLRGLQAAYSGVFEIIEDVPHVAAYKFLTAESRWERMEIEGSAYITRNSSSPWYSFIILNKKGSEDLVIHVLENMDKVQIQDKYVMIRGMNSLGSAVIGIWIHDDESRQTVLQTLTRIKSNNENGPKMENLLSKLSVGKNILSTSPPTQSVLASQPAPPLLLTQSAANNTTGNNTPAVVANGADGKNPWKGNKSGHLLNILKSSNPPTASNPQPPQSQQAETVNPTSPPLSSATETTVTTPNNNNEQSNGKTSALLSLLKKVENNLNKTEQETNLVNITLPPPAVVSEKKEEDNNNNKSEQLLSLIKPNRNVVVNNESTATDFPTDKEISAAARQQQQQSTTLKSKTSPPAVTTLSTSPSKGQMLLQSLTTSSGSNNSTSSKNGDNNSNALNNLIAKPNPVSLQQERVSSSPLKSASPVPMQQTATTAFSDPVVNKAAIAIETLRKSPSPATFPQPSPSTVTANVMKNVLIGPDDFKSNNSVIVEPTSGRPPLPSNTSNNFSQPTAQSIVNSATKRQSSAKVVLISPSDLL